MTASIIAFIQQGVGHITFNSQKTLNALNQEMVEGISSLLAQWHNDNNVSCIFLSGSGDRAFCAGGDIKSLYTALKEQTESGINQTCLNFFISEYRLDYAIHTYPKPIITWNSGITMGGGMGLMNGASHRIVTPESTLAMPEITIGLYPDVGATWFFNQLSPGLAFFLSLTAARLNAQDALELNLADFCLPKDSKDLLITKLSQTSWDKNPEINRQKITKICSLLSIETNIPSLTKSYLKDFSQLDQINTIEEFIKITKTFPPSSWLDKSLETFWKGSPSSAGVILEQLKRGRRLSLKEAFESELNLSVHCSLKPDFQEGIRALLIDKDQTPKWTPSVHADVTQEWIASYFTPIDGLKLFP
jgi:enoyl-CoA hydratase/carnithine racemase